MDTELSAISAIIFMLAELRWAVARMNKRLNKVENEHTRLKKLIPVKLAVNTVTN